MRRPLLLSACAVPVLAVGLALGGCHTDLRERPQDESIPNPPPRAARARLTNAAAAAGIGAVGDTFPRFSTTDLIARLKGARPGRMDFTLVDARTRVEFASEHIPGAIHVPHDEVPSGLPQNTDKGKLLVFYCNGNESVKSRQAATKATAAGFTDVRLYAEGLQGWVGARQVVDGTALPTTNAERLGALALRDRMARDPSLRVIDVRAPSEFRRLRLRGARSIPLDELEARRDEIPLGSDVVVVDGAGHVARTATRLLEKLGMSRVLSLEGGVRAWSAAGLPVEIDEEPR